MKVAVSVSPSNKGNFATIASGGVIWFFPPNGQSTVPAPTEPSKRPPRPFCEQMLRLDRWEVRSAEWGRWIMRSNSPAVFISYHLILKFAFNLELEYVYCNTHQQNRNALRIHDKLPYSLRERVENKSYVRHTLEKRDWDNFEKSLVRYSRMKLA